MVRPKPADPLFVQHLTAERIVMHPWVYGELILGGIAPLVASRIQTLEFLPAAPESEVYTFVRRYRPQGIGWVDVNLLVSCIEAGVPLWTKDRDLHANAVRHGRGFTA